MDDSIEVFGAKGQTYADLRMGNALPRYSEVGFGYASAGGRRITLPFRPRGIARPVDLWKQPALAEAAL